MMDARRLDERVLDLLRNIIQHHPRITVLLSGSHTIEDVDGVGATHASPLLSDYLINVRVLKIENLKEAEARELIVKPIENFPLEYESAAVERILAVTGCQPFLLQATCRDLVNQLNEQNTQSVLATQDDANRALESVLTTGVAYFQDLWGGRDSDDAQRAVMSAIATNTVGALHATPLQNALRKLVHRDILTQSDNAYILDIIGIKGLRHEIHEKNSFVQCVSWSKKLFPIKSISCGTWAPLGGTTIGIT